MSELNTFFKILRDAEKVKLLDAETKKSILEKYDVLATAYYCEHSANEEDKARAAVAQMDINNNIHVFEYITNPIFIETYFREKSAFSSIVDKSLDLKRMLYDKSTFDKVARKFVTPRLDINVDELSNVLHSYNMPDAEPSEVETPVEEGMPVEIDLPDDTFDSVEDILGTEELEIEIPETPTETVGGDGEYETFGDEDADEETEAEAEAEGETYSDEDLEDLEDLEDKKVTTEESDEQDDNDESALFNEYKKVFGSEKDRLSPINIAVNGILQSFDELYESCYAGIYFPDGVLTSNGILSYDKHSGGHRFMYNHCTDMNSSDFISNRNMYDKIYKAILYSVGVIKGKAQRAEQTADEDTRNMALNSAIAVGSSIIGHEIDGRKDRTPKYADVKDTPYMFPRLHTEIMTGYFGINKKMKDWAEEHKAKRTQHKLTRYSDVRKWAEKRLKDCFIQAIIDAGLPLDAADQYVTSVCQTMSKSIKNIIVITNMKDSYYTLKICSHDKLDAVSIGKEFCNYFNMNSNNSKLVSVRIKNDGLESNVIEYDVILSKADYEKASSFSAEVIDNIVQSGNVPSWGNAILGEKDSGGTLTFNFKEAYSISIYGATGSGKGIMTSALLTNAMAEGCDIFYFDGKPDNGVVLGKIAWDSGIGDAAVFNGLRKGSKTFQNNLEEFSHGIRDVGLRNRFINNIPVIEVSEEDIKRGKPKWKFNSESVRQQLIQVSLTLQGFQFIHDTILARTEDSNLEYLPNGNVRWAVLVIDEIQNAAEMEKNIRKMMTEYMNQAGEIQVRVSETKKTRDGETTVEKNDGKIKDPRNWSKDPGYLFCKQWLNWADNVCSEWPTVATIALRQSSTTMISIFQSNQWLNLNSETGKTRIAKLMLDIAKKSYRIVGKGSLVSTNKWDDENDFSWIDQLKGGKWALSASDAGLDEKAIIFKPFKVFTTDLGQDIRCLPDDYGAGADKCWQDASHTGKMPMGLQSYVKYMFSGLANELQDQVNNGERFPETVTPEGVLHSSFNYFNNVTTNNYNMSLIDYMYYIEPLAKFSGDIDDTTAEHIESDMNKRNQMLNGYEDDEDGDEFDLKSPVTPKPVSTPTTPITPSSPIQSGTPQQPQSQPLQNTRLPNIVSYSQLLEMDIPTQNRVVNKVVSETSKNRFEVNNTSNGATFGLQHLCYNLSILFGNNLADLKRVNKSMHAFARAYFERLANHTYELDYVPSINEVQQMLNPFGTTQRPNDFTFGPNGSAVPVNNQPLGGPGQGFTVDDFEKERPLTDEEMLINIERGVMQYVENPNNFGEEASVAYESAPQQPAFEYNSKGRTVWVNNGTQGVGSNIIGLGAENFVDSEPVSPPGGFWSMLGRTQNGQDQMFSKRNDYLINMIVKKMKNPQAVNRLSIEEHSITINGLLVNTDAVVDDARGIRLMDIIDVRKMLNTFRNVTTVTLDSPMFQQLIIQMGDADDDVKNVWNIFKSNPNLQTLNIQLTPGAAFERITRRDFRQNAGKVSEMASNARFRKNTDFMASVHNPRLNESGMGERNTAFKIAGNLGNNAKQRLMSEHPNIWTGAGYGALALVAGGVGVVIGAGKGIANLFRRH